jgi:hypothetical protein
MNTRLRARCLNQKFVRRDRDEGGFWSDPEIQEREHVRYGRLADAGNVTKILGPLCALILIVPAIAAAKEPDFRIERVPVPGGAELLTVLASAPDDDGEVPLLSLLRDTLGDADPDNDRLRSVWVLTGANPSLLQRVAAATPFFYWRPPAPKETDKAPSPVLDLSNTSRSVWSPLTQSLMQTLAIDSTGAMIRASTRRYRTNVADQRRAHLADGLAVLATLEEIPELRASLSEAEFSEIQARLTLASQTLGGLVTSEKLLSAYLARRSQIQQTRGHNWELLRQRAEANGLYFEPLGMGSPTHALVWIAREEVETEHPFDSQFLGISNPYGDEELNNWSGFSVRRWYDSGGREVEAGTSDAVERELIPLALYGLDYPKVPLLLVDFRSAHAAKRREMVGHAISDTITGLLGISKWGNWPYWAGSWGWSFWRTRHGAPTNGAKRLEAYAAVRRYLALDSAVDPELRVELQRRLEVMGVNPLSESVFNESHIARRRYAALLAYAINPNGLAVRLEKDRAAELSASKHSPFARAGLTVASITSFGMYSHNETERDAGLLPVLDVQRRAARELQFLETVADSTPKPELVWNMDEVRQALDSLKDTSLPPRSGKAARRLLMRHSDETAVAASEPALLNPHATAE